MKSGEGPVRAEILIPAGYRRLKTGELPRPGDLALQFPDMEWEEHEETTCCECGQTVKAKNKIPKQEHTDLMANGWFMIRKVKK